MLAFNHSKATVTLSLAERTAVATYDLAIEAQERDHEVENGDEPSFIIETSNESESKRAQEHPLYTMYPLHQILLNAFLEDVEYSCVPIAVS
jgi:hypothetical protein